MKYCEKIQIDHKDIKKCFAELNFLISKSIKTKHGCYSNYDSVILHTLPRKKSKAIASKFLPSNIANYIKGISFTDVKHVGPHKHTADNCALNLYLECNSEYTTFWEGEDIIDDKIVTDNGNGYYMVKIDGLTPVEHFQAKENEVWLIDTTQPHSVSYMLKSTDKLNIYNFLKEYTSPDQPPRKLLQFFFDDCLQFKDLKFMFSNH